MIWIPTLAFIGLGMWVWNKGDEVAGMLMWMMASFVFLISMAAHLALSG